MMSIWRILISLILFVTGILFFLLWLEMLNIETSFYVFILVSGIILTLTPVVYKDEEVEKNKVMLTVWGIFLTFTGLTMLTLKYSPQNLPLLLGIFFFIVGGLVIFTGKRSEKQTEKQVSSSS